MGHEPARVLQAAGVDEAVSVRSQSDAYRLRRGVLEVATAVHNLSAERMPVAIRVSSYFQLTDSPRDEWTLSVGARMASRTNQGVPTGVTEPIEQLFEDRARKSR